MDELKLCSNDIMHLKDKKSQADELQRQLIETEDGIEKAEQQVESVQQRLMPIEVERVCCCERGGVLIMVGCRKHCNRLLTNKMNSTSYKWTLVGVQYCGVCVSLTRVFLASKQSSIDELKKQIQFKEVELANDADGIGASKQQDSHHTPWMC
jgi:hypothetical protein